MEDGVLYGGDASTTYYTFNNIENFTTWGIKGDAITFSALPGETDPYAWDMKSRTEELIFTNILVPTTYQTGSENRGTGSFLDQLADLFYLYRNQGSIIQNDSEFPDSAKHWWFKYHFRYDARVDSTHTGDAISKDTTGFVTNSSNYWLPCLMKDVTIMNIDPVQNHVQVQVSLRRVSYAVGY